MGKDLIIVKTKGAQNSKSREKFKKFTNSKISNEELKKQANTAFKETRKPKIYITVKDEALSNTGTKQPETSKQSSSASENTQVKNKSKHNSKSVKNK